MSVTAQQKVSTKINLWIKSLTAKQTTGFALAFLFLISATWFVAVIRDKTRTATFIIPPGTSKNIQTGQAEIEIPDEINLTLGIKDTIVIENQDDVIHSFGPFVVGPHSTLTKKFDVPVVYKGACTFHPEQQMRLVVNPAPWDLFD